MIKGFKGLTLKSKINDYAYYHREEDAGESDPTSNRKVATHTSGGKKRKVTDTDNTNRNSPHKSLIYRIIPEIISVVSPPIDQTAADGVEGSGDNLHTRHMILLKEIVMETARSAAHVFRTPAEV